MHAQSENAAASWPLRVMRPWVVACAGGLAIGGALLVLEPTARETADGFSAFYGDVETSFSAPGEWEPAPEGFGAPAALDFGGAAADGSFSPAEPVSVDEAP